MDNRLNDSDYKSETIRFHKQELDQNGTVKMS